MSKKKSVATGEDISKLLDRINDLQTQLKVEELKRVALENEIESLQKNDDWTRGADGRANNSERFNELVGAVDILIRSEGGLIVSGQSERVALLIMAQLAHVHGLRPA